MIDILPFIFFSSAIKTLAPYQKLLHLEQLSSVNMSQFIEKESSVEDKAALNKELDSMEKARHAHFAEMKDRRGHPQELSTDLDYQPDQEKDFCRWQSEWKEIELMNKYTDV